MAVNKNFVVKNGLEVNTNLLVADLDTQTVGIGTTISPHELHVVGGIGATNLNITGVATIANLRLSGVTTFVGFTTFQGDINVGGASTFKGLVDINGGGQANTFKVEDLTNDQVVIAGTGGELEGDANFTFTGNQLTLGVGATVGGGLTASSVMVEDLTNNRVVIAGTDGELEDSSNFVFDGSQLILGVGATVGGGLTVAGTTDLNSTLDVSGNVSLGSSLDVTGLTELGDVNVSAGSTFGGLVDINAGGQANTFKVEDLTNNQVVIAGTGGELEGDANFVFDGSQLILGVGATVGGALTVTDNITIGGTDGSAKLNVFGGDIQLGTGLTFKGSSSNGHITLQGGFLQPGGFIRLSGGSADDALIFGTSGANASKEERIRLTGGGHVGIGTSIPTGSHAVTASNTAVLAVGVVTARQYFGDGSNLSGLPQSGIGIRSDGTTVGFGVTFLDFIGSGVGTATVDTASGIATVNISGGGGSVTINNNADNRIITGSGTADTLEGEANLTFDGTNLDLGDSKKIRLGDGQDLRLEHNSIHSYISNYEGQLNIETEVDDGYINIKSDNGSGGTTDYIVANGSSGEVQLYHYGTKKFATKAYGIDVTGRVEADDVNVSGASTFTGAIDANGDLDVDGRTELDITNIAETLNVVGISTFNSDVTLVGDSANIVFDKSQDRLEFADTAAAVFGSGDDLQIYHNNHSYIDHTGANNLHIRNTVDDQDVTIQTDDGSGGTATYFQAEGASGEASLHHLGNKKIATKAYGVDVTGRVEADDVNVSGGSTFTAATFNGNVGIAESIFHVGDTNTSFGFPAADTFTIDTGGVERVRITSTGALAIEGASNYGTSGQVLTSNGNDAPTWQDSGGVSEVDTTVSTTNPTGVGSFATASFRSASVIAQINQLNTDYQVGRYLMIHDGTTVTVVEESAVSTGSTMLGSFTGVIDGSNVELRVTLASAGVSTITTKIDTVTV